jgi:hypothetical protein
MITRRFASLAISLCVLLVLSACHDVSSTGQRNTPSETQVVTDSLPLSTDAKQVSATTIPAASPTPELEFKLAEGIDSLLEMSSGVGAWSPTDDRIAYLGCDSLREVVSLTVHQPPEFTPEEVFIQEIPCAENSLDLTWRPDGEWIVFTGANEKLRGLYEYSQTWVSDLQNSWLLRESDDGTRFTHYSGWMSGNVLIIWSYAGGGHQILQFVDVVNGRGTGGAFYLGYEFAENDTYLPIGFEVTPLVYRVVALKSSGHFNFIDYFNNGQLDGKIFPLDDQNNITYFLDWRGDTNLMLVLQQQYDPETFDCLSEELVFWDVDRDEIVIQIPNGEYGKISPDGRWLAYLISRQASSSEEPRSLAYCSYESVVPELRIMDLWTQDDVASFPVEVTCDAAIDWSFAKGEFAFSPDGSKIAIITESTTDNEIENIRIVTLDTFEDIGEFEGSLFHWSPEGSSFIYRNAEGQYEIVDLVAGESVQLIESAGEFFMRFEWSLRGEYLAISLFGPVEDQNLLVVRNPLY